MWKRLATALAISGLLSGVRSSAETVLFFTDFEELPVGDGQWSASNGWGTNNSRSGVDFIDDEAFGGALGKTAGLGLNQPSRNRVQVLTRLSQNAESLQPSVIEIETLISVKDSENSRRDDFSFVLFHPDGRRLAALRFDNEDPANDGSDFGIWRENGSEEFDTGFDFIHEELYDIFMVIDLEKNLWSISANGTPLFEKETFTVAVENDSRELGLVGYEWKLDSNDLREFGDNFMLVADLKIIGRNASLPPMIFIDEDAQGTRSLSWHGFLDRNYQIEWTPNLESENWLTNLPGSQFSANRLSQPFVFEVPKTLDRRAFFRVVQSE